MKGKGKYNRNGLIIFLVQRNTSCLICLIRNYFQWYSRSSLGGGVIDNS